VNLPQFNGHFKSEAKPLEVVFYDAKSQTLENLHKRVQAGSSTPDVRIRQAGQSNAVTLTQRFGSALNLNMPPGTFS